MQMSNLKKSIDRGIEFLEKQQNNNGGFDSLTTPDPEKWNKKIKYNTCFVPALILDALNTIKLESQNIIKIKERAAIFLIGQADKDSSFNYWEKDTKEYQAGTIPNDFDDTMAVWAALYNFQPKLLSTKVIAQLGRLWTDYEVKEGGPYFTWMISNPKDKKWLQTDLAVNANIGYLLSLLDISLPNLERYYDRHIQKSDYHSMYYPDEYPVIYYLSKFYRGYRLTQFKQYVRNKIANADSDLDYLRKAILTSTWMRLGGESKYIENLIDRIWKNQNIDGSWPPVVYCLDPMIKNIKHFAGADTLTTALCIEAIGLYIEKCKKIDSADRSIKKNHKRYKIVSQNVLRLFEKKLQAWSEELRLETKKFATKIIDSEQGQEIILLPYLFWLLDKKRKTKDQKKIENLCLASIFGWIAYTIYDNFLDEEAVPANLPMANMAFKEMIDIFGILENKSIKLLVKKKLNEMEAANFWEATRLRFDKVIYFKHLPPEKEVDRFYQKSSGHGLGPLIAVNLASENNAAINVNKWEKFFEYYLLARQLDDDAKDWADDMSRGQINGAALVLCHRFAKKYRVKKIVPKKDTKQLEELFWNDVINVIAKKIILNVKKAKKILTETNCGMDCFLFNKLDKLELRAGEAAKAGRDAREFLRYY